MVPAINEPIAAVASAAAPRPARAILLPSSAVIIDPASPGVLIKMDVVDPPSMAPYNTPANIITADTGPTATVTGNSNAIVKQGPIKPDASLVGKEGVGQLRDRGVEYHK